MTRGIYEIAYNECIAQNVYKMRLLGDTGAITAPGQFVNIALSGRYLRRPISICDHDSSSVTIIYKVVGAGTEQMSRMTCGQTLDLLCGLGNGFDIACAQGKSPCLVGGGVGVPPMYAVAKALGGKCTCVLGFQSSPDVFYEKELEQLGCKVHVATNDGSYGSRGFVTDILKTLKYDYYFACGPEPMLKAVHALGGSGQLSFEARMGCGFGACMGCSCETLTGYKRICVEGPVLKSEEVLF